LTHHPEIGLRNNSVQSIKVGRLVEVLLCTNADFGKPCYLFQRSANNVKAGTGLGGITSARVEPLMEPLTAIK
jgi:hypothetical protein